VTKRAATIGYAVARGGALFLGLMTAVGMIGELRGRTTDLSLWWIDLGDLDDILRLTLLAVFVGFATTWGGFGGRSRLVRRPAAIVFVGFGALALRDVIRFYEALDSGLIRPVTPVPLSLFLVGGLIAMGIIAARDDGRGERQGRRGTLGLVALAVGWAMVFPIAQMLFFGSTDYRRPADIAVVFGARVYADGQPSPLLADRIRTAVDLYKSGDVPILIMSGGDGVDGYNEAQVMRDVAVSAGVDPAAILVDPDGNSTEATVINVRAILATRTADPSLEHVIAVSQAYHLPRIQLAFGTIGVDVLTVPAAEAQPIRELPLLMLREVPAFWAYYVRICLG